MEALHRACAVGDLAVVQELVQQAPDSIRAADVRGCTALHDASWHGHLAVVQYLLQQAPDSISATDRLGMTALHLASSAGHLAVVQELVQQAPDSIRMKDGEGRTALHAASGDGDLAVVQYLVQQAPDSISATDDRGRTALHLASSYGDLEVVQYLAQQAPGNIQTADYDGMTALEHASSDGRLEVVRTLVASGAAVSISDLVSACRRKVDRPELSAVYPPADAAEVGELCTFLARQLAVQGVAVGGANTTQLPADLEPAVAAEAFAAAMRTLHTEVQAHGTYRAQEADRRREARELFVQAAAAALQVTPQCP